MQMVKRIIGGFFLSILLLWLFTPKHELYYLMEKSLKKSNNIIISNETIQDTWIGLNITNADIYIDGLKVANAKSLNFVFLFFYSKLTLSDLNIDKALHAMAPKKIDDFTATYSIINPLHIVLAGNGSIGEMVGSVDLINRKVHIDITKEKALQTIKKFLKKDAKKGWYYETNY